MDSDGNWGECRCRSAHNTRNTTNICKIIRINDKYRSMECHDSSLVHCISAHWNISYEFLEISRRNTTYFVFLIGSLFQFNNSAAASSRCSARTFTGFIPYSGNFKESMDLQEAALILGCRDSAAKEVISKRFKTLMKANHPDQGGSPFLASKINDAKTVLMKENMH